MFFFFQQLRSKPRLCVSLQIQFVDDQPGFDTQAALGQLQYFSKEHLPQILICNRITLAAVSGVPQGAPTILLPYLDPIGYPFD